MLAGLKPSKTPDFEGGPTLSEPCKKVMDELADFPDDL